MVDSGALEAGLHRFGLRVYYEDTDAGGLVYHASYLKFAERARTEMLRCLGLDHRTLRERQGLVFAVRRCAIEYQAAARLDDLLEVRTRLERLRGASLDLRQEIFRGQQLLTKLTLRLALLDARLRAARLPADLVEGLGVLRGERATQDG